MPALDRVRVLWLRGAHIEGCEAVLASQFLSRIERISIPNQSPPMIAALAAGNARPRTFSIHAGVAAVGPLVAAGFFDRVVDLHVAYPDDGTVIALAASPLGTVRSLELATEHLRGADLDALGARLDTLEQLVLQGWLDRDAVPALIRHVTGVRLRKLTLRGGRCDAIADLVRSPVLAAVEELALYDETFTTLVGEALRESPHRRRLRKLVIRVGDYKTPTGFSLDGVTVDDHEEPT
jgi:hypothetical protein